jgi:hypothetical protein
MIRFEYDKPTSGVRVSFVIRDGETGIPDIDALFTDLEQDGFAAMKCPQTSDNLEAIKHLAQFAEEQV